jgi:beta-galactosidase
MSFNESWRFQKGDPEGTGDKLAYEKIKDWVKSTGNEFVQDGAKRVKPDTSLGNDVAYAGPSFDDSGWRQLSLPHDFGIEGPFNQDYPGETGKLPWFGVAWYRKHFNVAAADKNKRLYLQIDGAMAYSTVWLNGKFVGGWPFGYASYELDLTPYIKFGAENVMAIRLDNPPESSRWYPGGGLYRNVWLVKTAPVHVGHWGTFVTTPIISEASATVDMRVTVNNDSASNVEATIRTSVSPLGQRSVTRGSASTNIRVPANSLQSAALSLKVPSPKLWSLESPSLYVAVTRIEQQGRVVDEYETVFGIRSIKFDEKEGFYLNGKHVYLKGVGNR